MKYAVIIPCYNEADRLPTAEYLNFLQSNHEVRLVFVNDGSSDSTLQVLAKLQEAYPNNVEVLDLTQNVGKAAAVRAGILHCLSSESRYEIFGYLDADLATSLEEWFTISQSIQQDVLFSFGARISKIDNFISRKKYRHYSGRVIATFISIALNFPVYDTQCGCKVFRRDAAELVFKDGFLSRWLFDVEIFFRLRNRFGAENMSRICREIPLHRWHDVAESKVKFTYFFRLWIDLFLIAKKYRNA